MFLAAIIGFDKKTGKEIVAIGLPNENHGDIYNRVAGRLDITDDSFGFVDPKTLKYYSRKNAASIAEQVTGDKDSDFESSEYYVGRNKPL